LHNGNIFLDDIFKHFLVVFDAVHAVPLLLRYRIHMRHFHLSLRSPSIQFLRYFIRYWRSNGPFNILSDVDLLPTSWACTRWNWGESVCGESFWSFHMSPVPFLSHMHTCRSISTSGLVDCHTSLRTCFQPSFLLSHTMGLLSPIIYHPPAVLMSTQFCF